MTEWKKFEQECNTYLKNKFSSFACFTHKGGSDSAVSDILVNTKNGHAFYIEVKSCPAQCGQFVLFPNLFTKTFEYSESNATKINPIAQKIIEHMNTDFESFKEAGTAGKDIVIQDGSQLFAKWIQYTYKDKGVKFFITNNKKIIANKEIIPIDKLDDYFYITAKYRVKRSGSNNVGRSNFCWVEKYVCQNYSIIGVRHVKTKIFVTSNDDLNNKRFVINGTEFMFSTRGQEYEIRKLSNTFNSNVIFTINLKPDVHGITDEDFIQYL